MAQNSLANEGHAFKRRARMFVAAFFDDWPVPPLESVQLVRAGRASVAAVMPQPDWTDAACSGDQVVSEWLDSDVAVWPADVLHHHRTVCGGCVLLTACREWALAAEEYLWWAGTSAADRERIRKERGQVLVAPHVSVYGLGTDHSRLAREAAKPLDLFEEDWS